MEKNTKTGPSGNTGRVRVPLFPTYGELRHVLRVWQGRPKSQILALHRAMSEHQGTPQNPADWKDPDAWISERLSGEHRRLAHAMWTASDKTLNPKHTRGHWNLCQKYELLVVGSDGDLALTDRGRDFLDQKLGNSETFLDEQEGLIELLTIVAAVGPAQFGAFVERWGKFLGRYSRFGTTSTIKDTLRRRMNNLLDRDLVNRDGRDYAITEAGLDYLKRAGTAIESVELPVEVTKYADDHNGRAILAAAGDSIEFANSLNPDCWATIVSNRRDLRFYVGQNIMMLLHASSMRVEVTLLPALVAEEHQDRIESAEAKREYEWPEGARRYLFGPKHFVALWPSIKEAHREAIRRCVMKTAYASTHHTDLIDFLNGTLGANLPQPDYVNTDKPQPNGEPGTKTVGFAELTQSLRDEGLLFSQELVANYVLALQAKRFAILTGISGTGKTRIAMAVAQHIHSVSPKTLAGTPSDAISVEVKPYNFEHSRMVLPVTVRSQLLDASETVGQKAERRIRVRYPAGLATLTYYWGDKMAKKSERLLFKGEFREWFQSTFRVGDRFWLRVHPSETDDPGELEIGLPETYVVVPVRPDWVDNRGLLGYLNPLTGAYTTTPFLNLLLRAREEEDRAKAAAETPHPFFVILDEMNLARVEHYFSDFLSALESGKDIPLHEEKAIESGKLKSGPTVPRRLTIPGNVFFTGTVNVDETTYMFSPKVLDRAFTIEFDQVDLEGFTQDEPSAEASGLNLGGAEGPLDLLRSSSSPDNNWKPSREDWKEFSKETPEHYEALVQLHGILERHHRHFGYRVANEIARFVNLAREQATEAVDASFDLALLQKVLPKFHGTQQELESLLEEIFQFAVHGGDHAPKKDHPVELDDWEVVKGRLVARSETQSPSRDAGAEGSETASDDPEAVGPDTESPAYPRTGAKVLRMLHRLRDRGFTSFIE